MARLAALGEQLTVRGFALAGVLACPAETPDAVRSAWDALPDDVQIVLLTPAAAHALGDEQVAGLDRLAVVMPVMRS
ncbi:MAG: V-type ATP synthase subunit F [Actinomycetes bacterium]